MWRPVYCCEGNAPLSKDPDFEGLLGAAVVPVGRPPKLPVLSVLGLLNDSFRGERVAFKLSKLRLALSFELEILDERSIVADSGGDVSWDVDTGTS